MITDKPPREMVTGDFRQQLLAVAEEYRNYAWPALPATRYMDFWRTGNRDRFELAYFQSAALAILVLAEWLRGRIFPDTSLMGFGPFARVKLSSATHHNQFYQAKRNDPCPEKRSGDRFVCRGNRGAAWILQLRKPPNSAAPQVLQRVAQSCKRDSHPYLERDDFGGWGSRRQTVT